MIDDYAGVRTYRRDHTGRHDFVRLGDHDICGDRHQGIEVGGGQTISQIADCNRRLCARMSAKSARNGSSSRNCLPLISMIRFSIFDNGADAGWGEYAAKPGASGANTLHERALRNEVDLDLALNHLFLCARIGADLRRFEWVTHPASISLPIPTPGRAVSLAMTVSSRAPPATSASIMRSGMPTPMKPPIMRLDPSEIKTAAASQ